MSRHPEFETLAHKNILVVEDDDDARELVKLILEACGAEVVDAASASEALRVLANFRVDLIISDIAMPGGDGYDLIRNIRAAPTTAAVPAVALTAFTADRDRSRALHAGFDLHLGKPLDARALLVAASALVSTRNA